MRSYSGKRTALLVAGCLVLILGSVELMNLQVRSRTRKTVAAKEAALSTAGYSSEYRGGKTEDAPVELGRSGGRGKSEDAPAEAVPSAGGRSGRTDQQAARSVSSEDLEHLRSEGLQIPVAGVNSSQLRDSFSDARSEGRRHEAIDIPAPLATPVVSAADGIVGRLFNSRLGGTTLYCFDKTGQFVFYYAHLSGYADGVAERKAIRKGDVLGYVGDTGNAGPGNCHLHFAISKASTPWKWDGGDAIDPYPLLRGN